MDYTEVPRELIYKDRLHLEDFDTENRSSLNGQLFLLLRRYLFVKMGRNDYKAIILMIFNEAYYLTTMLLMDDNAEDNFGVYSKSVLKDSPYPDEFTQIFRRLVLAISYIYLERPSVDSLKVSTVRRHLRNHAYEFTYLNSEISGCKYPEQKDFKPVTLTEKLLKQVNWKELTYNFSPENVKAFIDYLGETKKEKRLIIMSMYDNMIHSGEMYMVPYNVDSLLFLRYRQEGGRWSDFISLTQENIDPEEFKAIYKSIQDNPDLLKTLYDRMRRSSRLDTLEKENRELKQRNRLLENELEEMKAKYESQKAEAAGQKAMRTREAVMKAREESLKEQINEMSKIIDTLQRKLGNKAIQLKHIVESIQNKADFVGLKEAYYLFEQIDTMLCEEPVWRENRGELVNFFRERNKQNVTQSPRALNVNVYSQPQYNYEGGAVHLDKSRKLIVEGRSGDTEQDTERE